MHYIIFKNCTKRQITKNEEINIFTVVEKKVEKEYLLTGFVYAIKITQAVSENTDEKTIWFREYEVMNTLDELTVEDKILLRGSELARQFGVTNSTVKYYTILGLLEVSDTTCGGMRLYDYYPTKQRIKEILELREKGISIKDIQRRYGIIS